MRNKKLLPLILAAAVICSFAGCKANKGEVTGTTQDTTTLVVSESSTETQVESKTETASETNKQSDKIVICGREYDAESKEAFLDASVEITDIENLFLLNDLEKLDIYFATNDSADKVSLKKLSQLKSVKELYIGGYCNDLSFIGGMDSLNHLDLCQSYAITDLNDLPYNENVTELVIYSSAVKNIDYIYNLPNIEWFEFRNVDSDYIDFTPLSQLKKLKKLELTWVDVSSLSFIGQNTDLESLFLWTNNNKISDCNSLVACTKLKELNLLYSNIDNVDFLKSLPELSILELRGTNVKDMSALPKLTSLTSLSLDENKTNYYDLLIKMDFLQELIIDKEVYSEKELAELKEKLTECNINL